MAKKMHCWSILNLQHHFGVSNSPFNTLGKIFHAIIRLTDTRQHVFNRL